MKSTNSQKIWRAFLANQIILWSVACLLLLLICYFVASAVVGRIPIISPDSATYINFEPHRTAGYPAILATARLIGLGLGGVVAFQLIIFSIALAYFLEVLTRQLGRSIAFAVAAVTFVNPLMLISHFSIMTESITYSLLIVIAGLSIESVFRGHEVKRLALISLCTGFAIAVRPAAWALAPLVLILGIFLYHQTKHDWKVWVATTIAPLLVVLTVSAVASRVVNGKETTSLAPFHLFAKSMLISAGPAPRDLSPLQSRIWTVAEDQGAGLRLVLENAPTVATREALLRLYEIDLQHRYFLSSLLPIVRQTVPGPKAKSLNVILEVAVRRILNAPGQYLRLTWWEYEMLWMPFTQTVYSAQIANYFAQYGIHPASHNLPTGKRIRPQAQDAATDHQALLSIIFDVIYGALAAVAVLLMVAPVAFVWILIAKRTAEPRLFVSGLFGLGTHGSFILVALTALAEPRYMALVIPLIILSLAFSFDWIARSNLLRHGSDFGANRGLSPA